MQATARINCLKLRPKRQSSLLRCIICKNHCVLTFRRIEQGWFPSFCLNPNSAGFGETRRHSTCHPPADQPKWSLPQPGPRHPINDPVYALMRIFSYVCNVTASHLTTLLPLDLFSVKEVSLTGLDLGHAAIDGKIDSGM